VQRAMSVLYYCCSLAVIGVGIEGCSSATDPATSSSPTPAQTIAGTSAVNVSILRDLSQPNSCAQGVKDSGPAVGESEASDFTIKAVRWDGDAVSTLGTLGGPNSSAFAVNYRGAIVGSSVTGGGLIHAFFDAPGSSSLTDLGDLGGGFSSALAVNSWGVAVGSSTDAADVSRAFLWTPGTGLRAITPASEQCVATGINDLGEVVGDCTNSSGVTSGFVQTAIDGLLPIGNVKPITLKGLGGSSTIAWGVNDAGEVVGQSDTPDGTPHAVRWHGLGTPQTLTGLAANEASFAYAVNTEGTVVGAAVTAAGVMHAVEWGTNGRITDLGTADAVSSIAYAIDSQGAIVGCGFANGNSEGLWWGNGAPRSSGTSVLASARSATSTASLPLNYAMAQSPAMIARLGIHAGSPAAMRVLSFGR
jgi:probable HAF family extracellular repeat protein